MGRGEGVGPLGAADMARGVGSGLGDVSGLGGPRVIYILRNTNYVTQMKELSKLPCRKHEQDPLNTWQPSAFRYKATPASAGMSVDDAPTSQDFEPGCWRFVCNAPRMCHSLSMLH